MRLVIENYTQKPKARHRDGCRGKYTPTAENEMSLAWLIKQKWLEWTAKNLRVFGSDIPIQEKIGVILEIHSVKTLLGDIDNYEKLVYDALQKSGIIKNDRQIRKKAAVIYEGNVDDLLMPIEDKLVVFIEPFKP